VTGPGTGAGGAAAGRRAAPGGERRLAGTVVLAVATVQAVAFGAATAAGRPTLYVPVAVASALLLGWRRGWGWFGAAVAGFGSVLLVALGVPLATFLAAQRPGLVAAAATDPAVHLMLFLTVYAPLLATLFALAFGVPLAYLLARGFRGATLVQSLVDLPLVVPHSVAGIVILFGFGRRGLLPGVPVLGTLAGTVLALAFVSAPYAVDASREAFESVDRSLEHAARSHGASPFETFRRVSLPLAARGVLTGAVLSWARGVSEFGAVAVVAYTVTFFVPGLGEVASQHAPVYIFNTYTAAGLERAGAVAAVLLALTAGVFLAVRSVGDREGGGLL
jgi:molybdate/tungstate transport system permease protein